MQEVGSYRGDALETAGWHRLETGLKAKRVSQARKRWAAGILLWFLFACGGGDDPVEIESPGTGNPATGDTTGTVRRGSMTVTVRADGKAAEAMEALGGSVGRVPGAEVSIQRSGESAVRSGSTDSLGLVTFADVLPGRYRVTSLRLLDRGETLVVAVTHAHLAGINALGGGGFATVLPPAAKAEVEAVAGRRGSLVISEVHDWSPVMDFEPGLEYSQSQYVEVYNNADTTVYLDGKILASAFWYVWESSLHETSLDNCEEFRRWRLDPEGIWSEWHLRFPGSGWEYALAPGHARVVAMQAIDHREVAPELGFPDLSQADFEVVGTGQDVDNPAVPNMEDVGLRPSVDALGRGLLSLEPAIMIVDNVDLESLPVDELPLHYPDYRRFPAEALLDLVALYHDPATGDWDVRLCDRLVNEVFDHQPALILDFQAGNSIHRKVLGTMPAGRHILQRTRTSAVDLERGPRSLGWISVPGVSPPPG